MVMKPKKMPMKLSPVAASRIRAKAQKIMAVKPDKDSAAGTAT